MKYSIISIFGIMAILSGLVFSSCDKQEMDVPVEDVSLKPEWSWEKYKRSHELSLGTKSVAIQPKRSLEIQSESSGSLTILLDRDRLMVAKDHLWAQMDKENLERQKKKLEIDEIAKLLGKEKTEEYDRPEKIKKAEEELEEARVTIEKMKKLLSSERLLKNAEKIFPGIGVVNAKTLNKAEDDFKFAKKKLTRLQEIDKVLDEGKDEILEMDLVRAKEAYDEAAKRSNYTIPFSGELRLELDYVEGQKEYTVGSREVVATLNDYAEMHILLGVQGEPWISLPSESLIVRLSDRENTEIAYSDDKSVKNERTRREEKFYIFAIETEKARHLKRMAGTSMQANLLTKLEKRCWIVPKVDIAMEALGKSTSKVWADIVDDLWPGAKVLAQGDNALAIDYIPAQGKVQSEEE